MKDCDGYLCDECGGDGCDQCNDGIVGYVKPKKLKPLTKDGKVSPVEKKLKPQPEESK